MLKRNGWFPLALAGWQYWLPILFGGGTLTAAVAILLPFWFALVPAVVTIACLLFFRDPMRVIPQQANVMVAPADGVITELAVVQSPFLPGETLRISIFLSVLDVHINRSPCAGTIQAITFEPGRFLDARHPEAAMKNQSNNLRIDTIYGPIVVRQIVGAIARRIICPARVGDMLTRGERFGMIAFGSRTELLMSQPDQWVPCVQVGEKVRAGSTILLRHRSSNV